MKQKNVNMPNNFWGIQEMSIRSTTSADREMLELMLLVNDFVISAFSNTIRKDWSSNIVDFTIDFQGLLSTSTEDKMLLRFTFVYCHPYQGAM